MILLFEIQETQVRKDQYLFYQNVYMIADANHGYKMIGVGELVAKEILGTESELLKPFRFDRYEKGELHPTSNSPFPWS